MSQVRELKKVLHDTLQIETELYDFCIECLKEIFKDEKDCESAISHFEDGYDSFDYNGCIQSLYTIKNAVARWKKERDEAIDRQLLSEKGELKNE